jgi:hypothetical protein
LWLAVTTLLGLLSGWFRLAARFPDRSEQAVLRLRGQSGSMGLGVRMNTALRLSVCSSGLRVGMIRILGPFCRDFFVRWESIAVSRRKGLFGTIAELQFGNPVIGRLRISETCANRLAHAAAGRWPEAGPLPQGSGRDRFRRVFREWALVAGFFAGFFIVVPLLVAPLQLVRRSPWRFFSQPFSSDWYVLSDSFLDWTEDGISQCL